MSKGEKSIVLLLILIVIPFITIAQKTYSIHGIVKSYDTKKTIEMANVGIKSISRWTTTDAKGKFSLYNVPKGEYTFLVSFIGYKDSSQKIVIDSTLTDKNIYLESSCINLKEVVVIAKESKTANSSSKISKQAISHLQPSSFSELLELLPGSLSIDPHLGSINIVSLRQVGCDVNTSLGTSFIIDGSPLSNDANLQSIKGSWEKKISKRNTTGLGIDMRTISTDDIESVEIIRGIPSVQYGDLTSGLIKIKRRKGISPYQLRLKSDPKSKMLYLGKGFDLTKSSSLNIGLDILDYKSDPRNVLDNYKRITSSFRYNKRFEKVLNPLSWNINLDYTGSFDDDKQDKEINYGVEDYYASSYNNIRLNNSLVFDTKSLNWLDNIEYLFTISYTHDKQKRNKLVSLDRDIPWTITTNEGVNDGVYLPNEYQAYMEVDAKPINMYSKISALVSIPNVNIYNKLVLGADYKYDKNLGKGELINHLRPVYTGSSRQRAYKDVPSQQRFSFFAEENIKLPLGGSILNIIGGIRATKLLNLSLQFSDLKPVFLEPRVNIKWHLTSFDIFQKSVKLSLNTGYGEHFRFPVLAHLYPQKRYYDLVQLNYYHQNKKYRRINFLTKKIDPTNYNISPAINKKYELGLDVDIEGNRLSVTVFRERLSSGFRSQYKYKSMIHKKYNNNSIDHATQTAPPLLKDMSFVLDTNVYMYSQQGNGSLLIKEGVEFQLDLKRIKSLYTKLTINGAWFRTTYSNSMPVLQSKNVVLDGKTIDYIGEYDWDSGFYKERLNTNIRFDTQIPNIGLIFSTLIECEWYTAKKYIEKANKPISYIDKQGGRYPYTLDSEKDTELSFLVFNFNKDKFKRETTPFEAYLNLKVSKDFSKKISLAMYVNRILSYLPTYEQNGFEVNRRSSPYFGLELRVKLNK